MKEVCPYRNICEPEDVCRLRPQKMKIVICPHVVKSQGKEKSCVKK
jgi:hypothetical protein